MCVRAAVANNSPAVVIAGVAVIAQVAGTAAVVVDTVAVVAAVAGAAVAGVAPTSASRKTSSR
jgi:hypothetical protein